MAVDPASGRNLWSFDSGLPLVSASNFQPDRSIFPGADGALYVYKADSQNKQGVEVWSDCMSVHQIAETPAHTRSKGPAEPSFRGLDSEQTIHIHLENSV